MKAAISLIHIPEVATHQLANSKASNFLGTAWTAYKQFTGYDPRPAKSQGLGIEATDASLHKAS